MIRETASHLGHLHIDEQLLNRCAVALVVAICVVLFSMAWKNLR
jgi:hypothetical protein